MHNSNGNWIKNRPRTSLEGQNNDECTVLYLLKRKNSIKDVFTRSKINKLFQSIDEIPPYPTTVKNSIFLIEFFG